MSQNVESLTPAKHNAPSVKRDDPTMATHDQSKIAATSENGNQDGEHHNGEQANLATGSTTNASDFVAKQDDDNAAVSKELKRDSGHAKKKGPHDLLANNELMDSDDDRTKSNQSLQPVPMKEEGQSAVQMVGQPNVLVCSADASNNSETEVSKDATSTNGMVENTNCEQNTSPQQKKEVPINDVVLVEPVRKSQRARLPSFKYAANKNDEPIIALKPKLPALTAKSTVKSNQTPRAHQELHNIIKKPLIIAPKLPAPRTPQELHNRIKKSHDKLFFIAYSHNKDPLITPSKNTKKGNNKMVYQWHLVRVDLSTCEQLGDTEDCEKTGKYYVEFYTKASYDQGILLPGNPLENGITSAKMKRKVDSDSRYWLEWHDYYFDKNGDMVVGKAKEFLPNSKKAIHRRLMDLYQRQKKRQNLSSQGSVGSSSEGEDRLMSEYHPNFDKYTTWADVINLMDTKTRLVGPFDFDDVTPPPLEEKDLAIFNQETKDLFSENHSNLHVKDRVDLSRWQELTEAIKGRDIAPPTIPVETSRKKKRVSGSKRVREDLKGQANKSTGHATQLSSVEVVNRDGGKGGTEKEPILFFPSTSTTPSLAKMKHDQTIMSKDNIMKCMLSMVEATLTQTRQATSGDGEAYYVFEEVKEVLNKALGSWTGGMASVSSKEGTKVFSASAKSSEPLEGFSEAKFTEEEIESFPVAFAYNNQDPSGISEKNAKIAALDYEVEQRRLKRAKPNSNSRKGSNPRGK